MPSQRVQSDVFLGLCHVHVTHSLSFAQTHRGTPAYVSICLLCTCGSWSLVFLVAVAAKLGIWGRNIHLSAVHLKLKVPKEAFHSNIEEPFGVPQRMFQWIVFKRIIIKNLLGSGKVPWMLKERLIKNFYFFKCSHWDLITLSKPFVPYWVILLVLYNPQQPET